MKKYLARYKSIHPCNIPKIDYYKDEDGNIIEHQRCIVGGIKKVVNKIPSHISGYSEVGLKK